MFPINGLWRPAREVLFMCPRRTAVPREQSSFARKRYFARGHIHAPTRYVSLSLEVSQVLRFSSETKGKSVACRIEYRRTECIACASIVGHLCFVDGCAHRLCSTRSHNSPSFVTLCHSTTTAQKTFCATRHAHTRWSQKSTRHYHVLDVRRCTNCT